MGSRDFENKQTKQTNTLQRISKNKKSELEWWLKSDPRGYIKAATDMNARNNDFRKTTKFIKRWKHNCKEKDKNFKLKSFHVEQVIARYFQYNADLEMVDAIFKFFREIPDIIARPQIKDRADQDKFIDAYLNDLTDEQKQKIIEARDHFLIELENFSPTKQPSSSLLAVNFYRRVCKEEQYLFDFSIPVFTENVLKFKIDGQVLPKPGFRNNWWLSDSSGGVEIGRKVRFQIRQDTTSASVYKWKVKNDNSAPQPRGEITDNHTRNNPESTAYRGNHYVECYAIKNNVCVAKSRQRVLIK